MMTSSTADAPSLSCFHYKQVGGLHQCSLSAPCYTSVVFIVDIAEVLRVVVVAMVELGGTKRMLITWNYRPMLHTNQSILRI